MAPYFIERCTQPPHPPEPACAGLRALRLDPGRAARDPGVGQGAGARWVRRSRSEAPRSAPHAGARGARLEWARHRRRHSEVAVISRRIVYAARAHRRDRFAEAIINYVRRNYGILIGEATASASRSR